MVSVLRLGCARGIHGSTPDDSTIARAIGYRVPGRDRRDLLESQDHVSPALRRGESVRDGIGAARRAEGQSRGNPAAQPAANGNRILRHAVTWGAGGVDEPAVYATRARAPMDGLGVPSGGGA